MHSQLRTASFPRNAATALLTSCCVAAIAAIALPATAQDKSSKSSQKTVDIRTWKLDSSGWSVRTLVGKDVRGLKGEEIGEVENIVFSPEGKVLKLIFATGGVFGIGDKNLAVKWSDVKIGPGYEYVTVPVTEESIDRFGLFDGVPERSGAVAPRQWRSSELIGDYVSLKDGGRYAYVRDLIVSQDGQLQSVIVSPDVGYARGLRGYYAYPFYGYGYGWNPGLPHYTLPYGKAEIADLTPYAYSNK